MTIKQNKQFSVNNAKVTGVKLKEKDGHEYYIFTAEKGETKVTFVQPGKFFNIKDIVKISLNVSRDSAVQKEIDDYDDE